MKALDHLQRAPLGKLSPSRMLSRILDAPELPEMIRAMPPSELHAVIERVGLEDAGELVAFATTEQLASIFDVDLWRNVRPGEEETFDAERFGLWLEVLAEAGDAFVAERLAALPEPFLIFAMHSQMLVLDMDSLTVEMAALAEDDEPTFDRIEKALGDGLCEELDNYRISARRPENWDAVLSAVLSLDREDHALLERVLRRCAAMSAAYIEDAGGLYEVLTEAESLNEDMAGEREERRSAEGYVEPRAAKNFLVLAASPSATYAERDPVTRAYFRDVEQATSQVLEPRREEMAYLANVLVAAGTIASRRVRPIEAVRAVRRVITHACQTYDLGEPAGALARYTADELFRRGWAKLHERARLAGRSDAPTALDVLDVLQSFPELT